MRRLRRIYRVGVLLLPTLVMAAAAQAALVVPNEIQMPGTQPREVGNLESPDKCDNCHGGYDQAVEPAFNWRGSAMANAGRDPVFWATLAVAEQDFDGSGDLCLRCHAPQGWYAGRSTPTDGSGLSAQDSDGVLCDLCHTMTNPNGQELAGVMNEPYVANDGGTPATGYYGSGMLSLSDGSAKLGPYVDADARHQFQQSAFHRDAALCGSCHDVSNPAVGDLAPNNGTLSGADAVTSSGTLGSPLDTKAAFNNLPYTYGIVERTFSEHASGALSSTLVSDYTSLPGDLQAGAIKAAHELAGGDYADGTPRTFSCQTCHLEAVTGKGANKQGVPTRTDLPLHDMTGGNYWLPDAIAYQDAQSTLRLGGGLSSVQQAALVAGKDRALQQLDLAAALKVTGNNVRVTNLTGHKLISGYPEGRRMWLDITWYSDTGTVVREDGAYGPVATYNGAVVNSIVDPDDPNTKIYEAEYGMTQAWASELLTLGFPADLALRYDRVTGAVTETLGQLAAEPTGFAVQTFHFVLNNTVVHDDRIPPYGMSYDAAQDRNTLPVPADQYGNPGPGGTFDYFDDVALSPPSSATYADIRLLYQPTSWEYIQFLDLANNGSDAFLAAEGTNLLDAWLATGQAEPHVMATATWGSAPVPACSAADTPQGLTANGTRKAVSLSWAPGPTAPDGGYRIYYVQGEKLQLVASVGPATTSYRDNGLSNRTTYTYAVTAWTDCDGNGTFDVGTDLESAPAGPVSATTR